MTTTRTSVTATILLFCYYYCFGLTFSGIHHVDAFVVCSATTTATTKPTFLRSKKENDDGQQKVFDEFVQFIIHQQKSIIESIENNIERGGETFTNDGWGMFGGTNETTDSTSGGRTRVLQGGDVIEKGACSITILRNQTLSTERANAISGRGQQCQAGDLYSAAALSMVLHTKHPHIPTFRSDVRAFLITKTTETTTTTTKNTKQSFGWFGGGADLTPYYLQKENIRMFHTVYKSICDTHNPRMPDAIQDQYTYAQLKQNCDDYFYLPARGEHRGTGGIFWDDMILSSSTLEFTKNVATAWMEESWYPIVQEHRDTVFTSQEKQWQKIRRGRYLEFNLLYDRGVRFGLANSPRVEGVMVSAPPEIAYVYNHVVEPNSPEAALVSVLKTPVDWV